VTTSTLTIEQPRTRALGRALDYIELTKPKIAVLELVVVVTAAFVATWGQPEPGRLLHAMMGTFLVAASASAANQWLERYSDARMNRTAARPLPAGRLSGTEAITFAAVALLAGSIELALGVNLACCAWALLTWVLYVLAYTPLKPLSSQNTPVGALAGALPVLIGWSAAGLAIDQRAIALALVLFLWQFPHFMAIAWRYRHEYARAGLQMLTVTDPTGQRAGRQAVFAALAIVPVSIMPVLNTPGLGSLLYVICAVFLGAGQLLIAILFWRRTNDITARLLLRASLVYLPTLLVTLALAPWI
jgi:protoheme IX farnesyltransferase